MFTISPELHFFEVEPLAGNCIKGGGSIYKFSNSCAGLPLSPGDLVVVACKFDKKQNINRMTAMHNCTSNTRELFGATRAQLIGELGKYWIMVLFCILTCFVIIGALFLPFVLIGVIFMTVFFLRSFPKAKKVDEVLLKLDGLSDKEDIIKVLSVSYDGPVHIAV